MRTLHVFTILLIFSHTSLPSTDIPQMQVLYYSSDPSLPWPPTSTASSAPPSQWPGHKEQLAKHHPRVKVDVAYKKGFPSAQDFYTNFVERGRPVIFSNAVDNKDYEFLSLQRLNTSGRAALSFLQVSSFTAKEKQEESIWSFTNKMMSKPFYVSDNLHNNYKNIFKLPPCLQCSYLVDLLVETRHVLMGHVYPLPLKQAATDVLHCQVDGSKELLLVDPRDSGDVESLLDMTAPDGRTSLLNSLSVDYEKYPSLTRVKEFKIALLGPGDCIYIPAYWLSQANILTYDNSVEIRWTSAPWTPDTDCTKGLKNKYLSSLSFQGEQYYGVDSTLDKKKALVEKVSRILDKVLMEKKRLNYADFMAEMIKDEELLPDLQEWTQESSARAKEMFETLDMNKDNIVDDKDVEMLTGNNVSKFMGKMEDRLADMMDIIMDQRVDFSLAGEMAKSRSSMAEQILIQDSVGRDEL